MLTAEGGPASTSEVWPLRLHTALRGDEVDGIDIGGRMSARTKKMKVTGVLSGCILSSCAVASSQDILRTWTSISGSQVIAVLEAADKSSAFLRERDGTRLMIPQQQLIAQDRQRIALLLASKAIASAPPEDARPSVAGQAPPKKAISPDEARKMLGLGPRSEVRRYEGERAVEEFKRQVRDLTPAQAAQLKASLREELRTIAARLSTIQSKIETRYRGEANVPAGGGYAEVEITPYEYDNRTNLERSEEKRLRDRSAAIELMLTLVP